MQMQVRHVRMWSSAGVGTESLGRVETGRRVVTFGPIPLPADASVPRTGMAMCVHLHVSDGGAPHVLAGYEDGR